MPDIPEPPHTHPGDVARKTGGKLKNIPKPVLIGIFVAAVALGLYMRHRSKQAAADAAAQDNSQQSAPDAGATYDPSAVGYDTSGLGSLGGTSTPSAATLPGYYDPGQTYVPSGGTATGSPAGPDTAGSGTVAGDSPLPVDTGTATLDPKSVPPSIPPDPSVSTGGGAPVKPSPTVAHAPLLVAATGHSIRYYGPGTYPSRPDPTWIVEGHSSRYNGPGYYYPPTYRLASTGHAVPR